MAPKPLVLAGFLAVVTASGALVADPAEGDGSALEMAADHVDLDVGARSAVLTGNVRLSKGALTVRCPRVEVRYDDKPSVIWLRGSGGVTAEMKGTKAEAPEVELDLQQKALELRGGVRLTRGQGAAWITAERAAIQLATGKVAMTAVKGSIPVATSGLPSLLPVP